MCYLLSMTHHWFIDCNFICVYWFWLFKFTAYKNFRALKLLPLTSLAFLVVVVVVVLSSLSSLTLFCLRIWIMNHYHHDFGEHLNNKVSLRATQNTGSIRYLGYFSPLYESDTEKLFFYVGYSPVDSLMTYRLILEYVNVLRIVYIIHVWFCLYYGTGKGLSGPLLGPIKIKGHISSGQGNIEPVGLNEWFSFVSPLKTTKKNMNSLASRWSSLLDATQTNMRQAEINGDRFSHSKAKQLEWDQLTLQGQVFHWPFKMSATETKFV